MDSLKDEVMSAWVSYQEVSTALEEYPLGEYYLSAADGYPGLAYSVGFTRDSRASGYQGFGYITLPLGAMTPEAYAEQVFGAALLLGWV